MIALLAAETGIPPMLLLREDPRMLATLAAVLRWRSSQQADAMRAASRTRRGR